MKSLRHITCTILFIMILGVCIASISCQMVQDELDQRALRKHFRIPGNFKLIDYDGFPPMSGFGQREGLTIRAVYRLKDRQQEKYIEDIQAHGWHPLPMPEEVRTRILLDWTEMPFDAEEGFYICKTAGDNVLHAKKTKPCDEASRLNDLILGILETDKNELSVFIWSGY